MMLARVASALVLIPALIAAVVYAPPWAFLLILGSTGSLALFELLRLVEHMGGRPLHLYAYPALWLLMAGLHWHLIPAARLITAVVLASFLVALSGREELRRRAIGMTASLAGVLYLGLCLNAAMEVRYSFGAAGLHWMLLAFVVIWAGDTAALFAGRRWGNRRFAPEISPQKTNVGTIAGLIAGIAAAIALRQSLEPDLPLQHVVAAAFLMGLFGQLGDLAESLLKRAAGVKDSSHLIPGHGGVLDRIDSLLFAFPVLHAYLAVLYDRH